MYQTIMKQLAVQLPKQKYDHIKDRQFHLGIFIEPGLTDIIAGRRTIEARFSKNKSAPYQKINPLDVVIMKKTGGNVVGYFTVKDVKYLNIGEISMPDIKAAYNSQLCIADELWEMKKDSKYASLIYIDDVNVLKNFAVPKKGMQTWIVL